MSDMLCHVRDRIKDQKMTSKLAVAVFGGFFFFRIVRRFVLSWALKSAHTGRSKVALLCLKILGGRRPPLMEFQKLLPKLPVPSISKTLQSWLESVEPLVSDEEYKDAVAACKEFEASDNAKALQKILFQRAATMSNWFSDWWVEFAYLRSRAPLAAGSNFFSTDQFENMYGQVCTTDQVSRAAEIVTAHLDFKYRTDTGTQNPQRLGGVVPVCMDGYRMVHGTTRIPGEEIDVLRTHVVPKNGDAHILLMIGTTMFRLDVQIGGLRVPCEALQAAIRDALSQASATGKTKWGQGQFAQPNISLLTSLNRTKWAKYRTRMMLQSRSNALNMELVEQALFGLVLLDKPSGCPQSNQKLIEEAFCGDATRLWFDKSFSAIVFSDARVAWHYEHTYADAPVPGLAVEHALVAANPRCKHLRIHPAPKVRQYALPVSPQLLQWDTDAVPQLEDWLAKAKSEADLIMSQIAIGPYYMNEFGINDIKKFGVSPDAFCQAALQVASYRFFGRHVLTYESASLRAFQGGRTETIRSATKPMTAFAKAFCDGEATKPGGQEKVAEMLREAGKKHQIISKDAAQFKGGDRHLLALKIAALVNGLPMPRIFDTAAYKNLDFELATSQSPILQEHMKASITMCTQGGGFAPITSPGVGVSYHPQRERIYFHISVKSPNAKIDQERFTRCLSEAMEGMRALFLEYSTT